MTFLNSEKLFRTITYILAFVAGFVIAGLLLSKPAEATGNYNPNPQLDCSWKVVPYWPYIKYVCEEPEEPTPTPTPEATPSATLTPFVQLRDAEDKCPNLEGKQDVVPAGMALSGGDNGQCLEIQGPTKTEVKAQVTELPATGDNFTVVWVLLAVATIGSAWLLRRGTA